MQTVTICRPPEVVPVTLTTSTAVPRQEGLRQPAHICVPVQVLSSSARHLLRRRRSTAQRRPFRPQRPDRLISVLHQVCVCIRFCFSEQLVCVHGELSIHAFNLLGSLFSLHYLWGKAALSRRRTGFLAINAGRYWSVHS